MRRACSYENFAPGFDMYNLTVVVSCRPRHLERLSIQPGRNQKADEMSAQRADDLVKMGIVYVPGP